ncbi:MAG: histidine phosphatase family protein [Defluviitaleaceae bacterium]|nr:histidine phosphatase family protein [Defluviitaleaceae bacterium]
MKIFTIRHGQTEWNVQRRLQGHSDIALDDVGLEQARRIGLRLASEKVDIIYTSDLMRAVKTAETINAHHGVEIIATPMLREMSFGIYEGMNIEEIAHEIDWEHPDGSSENRTAAIKRIHSFLDEVIAKQHENIFIVAHYGSIRAAIKYFLETPREETADIQVGNTAIHCFERDADGKFKMILNNDTSHLL